MDLQQQAWQKRRACRRSARRVGSQNRLINTSPTRAQLPFRVDCIANKTQVVSAREEESKEVKAKERGRQEESEGARRPEKREQKQERKDRKDGRRRPGDRGDSGGQAEWVK